jgi:hypothetical protein
MYSIRQMRWTQSVAGQLSQTEGGGDVLHRLQPCASVHLPRRDRLCGSALTGLLKGTKCSEEECLLQGAQEKSWLVVRAWNNNDDDNPSAAASRRQQKREI